MTDERMALLELIEKGADADLVKAQGLRPDIADYMASIGIRLAAS